MNKEFLIIATITVVVLLLASSALAMQSAFIPEYQPICPNESYNKITKLYEQGLTEGEIAEELEYVPPKEHLPRPTTPVEQVRLIMAQNRDTSVEPKSPVELPVISASKAEELVLTQAQLPT
jgi:hypothetical protein